MDNRFLNASASTSRENAVEQILNHHTLVFIAGLHRSGTTLLAEALQEHSLVSGFHGTGVKADEGQFLQTVYPQGNVYGGVGQFAFHTGARLAENSPLVSEANRRQLLQEWSQFWDLDKPVLLEKSPPNLVRTRFLQALFPRAIFVILVRHPVPVAMATQKWSRTSLGSLLHHWLISHEIFCADEQHLARVHVLRFEDFIRDPEETCRSIFRFIGIDPVPVGGRIRADANESYFKRWERLDLKWPYRRSLAWRLEARVNEFGYSLRNLRSIDARGAGSRWPTQRNDMTSDAVRGTAGMTSH